MNVEASQSALDELATNFRYNDAVLRNLVIRRDDAVTAESPIIKAERDSRDRRPPRPAPREDRPPADEPRVSEGEPGADEAESAKE